MADDYNPFIIKDRIATAMSRHTRVPTIIRSGYNIADSYGVPRSNLSYQPDETTGEYSVPLKKDFRGNFTGYGDPKISLDLGPEATYQDVGHALAHEEIHSALTKINPDNTVEPTQQPHASFLETLLHNPVGRAQDSWYNSKRGGHDKQEIPAYMMAYKPGELKDITRDDAKHYQSVYLNSIEDIKKRNLIRKIMLSNDAALAFGK